MSVAEVRRRSHELQDKARRRLAAIYVAGAGNAGIPLILMWFLPELRLALGYLVVTAVFLVSFVRHRSTVQAVSPEMTADQGLAFYRQALERERDVRRDSTWWFTVGPALNILILGLAYIRSPLFHGTMPEVSVVTAILVTHVIVLARVVRKLQGEARAYQRDLGSAADHIFRPRGLVRDSSAVVTLHVSFWPWAAVECARKWCRGRHRPPGRGSSGSFGRSYPRDPDQRVLTHSRAPESHPSRAPNWPTYLTSDRLCLLLSRSSEVLNQHQVGSIADQPAVENRLAIW